MKLHANSTESKLKGESLVDDFCYQYKFGGIAIPPIWPHGGLYLSWMNLAGSILEAKALRYGAIKSGQTPQLLSGYSALRCDPDADGEFGGFYDSSNLSHEAALIPRESVSFVENFRGTGFRFLLFKIVNILLCLGLRRFLTFFILCHKTRAKLSSIQFTVILNTIKELRP